MQTPSFPGQLCNVLFSFVKHSDIITNSIVGDLMRVKAKDQRFYICCLHHRLTVDHHWQSDGLVGRRNFFKVRQGVLTQYIVQIHWNAGNFAGPFRLCCIFQYVMLTLCLPEHLELLCYLLAVHKSFKKRPNVVRLWCQALMPIKFPQHRMFMEAKSLDNLSFPNRAFGVHYTPHQETKKARHQETMKPRTK